MTALIKAASLGPADHGRPVSVAAFEAADFVPGYKYELIDGRLFVSYEPDPPEDLLATWLFAKMLHYSEVNPTVINYVTTKARVFLPSRSKTTIPEPDLAAYHNFPRHLPARRIRWQDVSPLLVAEVLSPNDPHKDLIRNVQLYLRVRSIKEYWLLDGRDDADRPSMRVHRRHGPRWRIIDMEFGDSYATRMLPDFRLIVDPRN